MSENILDVNKIIVTRQNSSASSAAAPSSLDYGELAVDINGVLRTGNKNKQVVTHVVSTDSRLTDTRNPKVTSLTNQNLNDITTPGFYYAGGGNTVTNKPSGIAAFGLLVEQTASGYRSQLLIGGDSLPNKMFIRQYTSTAWGAWQSFYTTAYKPTPSEIGAAETVHNHTKSQITDFPTSLKNPTSVTVQLNGGTTEGTNKFTYDGSAAKNINITPAVIGAATSLHTQAASTITGLAAGRALMSDASGHPAASTVTSTELGYLDGVTSNIQTQLNGKSPSRHTHPYLPLSGGTMTGAITLPGNPTSNLHAATKQYVDSQIAGSGSGDMLKSVYDTDNDGIVDSSEKVESDGKKTSTTNSTTVNSAANEIPKTGISMYEFYNTTNSPITFANVINVRGRQADGAGQLALGWEGSSTTPNIFYRAHSNQGNVAWGPWEKIVYESDLPSIKKTITINGDSDKYYPVKISGYTNIKSAGLPAKFCIIREYDRKAPDDWNTAIHRGSLQFISKIFVNGWSGETPFMEWKLSERYSVTFGGIQHSARGKHFIVWLRGGGAEYDLIGENPALNATIYYETTDLTTDLGFSVSPMAYGQIPDDYPKFAKKDSAHWEYNGTGIQKNTLHNVDLTGAPKAVTPSASDNSTRIATTAYVKSNLLIDGISTYTHSKTGTVHTLTGSGDNIRFIAAADFTSGDTFKIGATTVTAKTIGGDVLWTGFFKTGAVVMCYKNGNALTFNGGGLPSTEAAKLTPNNIKTGVSVVVNGQQVDGIFTADATASASSIAPGKTAYVNGQKVTGNFTNDASAGGGDIRSGKTAYVKGQKVSGWLASRDTGVPNWIEYVRLANGRFEVAPPAGIHGCYWDGGQYSYLNYDQVRNAIGLTADKIVAGNTILGITGTANTQSTVIFSRTSNTSGTIAATGYGQVTNSSAGENAAAKFNKSGNVRCVIQGYRRDDPITVALRVNGNNTVVLDTLKNYTQGKVEQTFYYTAGQTLTLYIIGTGSFPTLYECGVTCYLIMD